MAIVHRRGTMSAGASLSLLALVASTVALFAQPQLALLASGEGNVLLHVVFAEQIRQTGDIYPAHAFYHVLVILVQFVTAATWIQAHLITVLALQVWLAIILWWQLRTSMTVTGNRPGQLFPILGALALMLVAPITVLTWNSGNYYFGYLVSHQYNSQTMIALKPPALLAFFAALHVGRVSARGRSKSGLLKLGAWSAISAVAKPNFSICFVPAVLLALVRDGRRGTWRDRLIVALCLAVPVGALVLWQYETTYLQVQARSLRIEGSPSAGDVGVRLAPMLVMGTLSSAALHGASWWWLAPKFVLSIAFPVAVAAAWFKSARRDRRLELAWLTFGIGAFFTYFLAEFPQYIGGNFTWSGQIAVFILFVASALFFLEQVLVASSGRWQGFFVGWRRLTCSVLFLVHVGCGWLPLTWPYLN